MTSKERILTALAGGRPDVMPVGIDYMGLYLAERIEWAYVNAYRRRLEREGRIRIDPDGDVQIRARATLQAYECFRARHDFMNIFGGPSRKVLRRRELALENDKVFELDLDSGTRRQMLMGGEESKTEEFRDIYDEREHALRARTHIDELLANRKAASLASRGDMRLVEAIVRAGGDDYFIYTGGAAPFWSLYGLIDFEGMMTALHDAPDDVLYMMDCLLEQVLEYAQAFKDAGGHGIRIEECLASADVISARMYERFALPYEEKLFVELRRMGLKTILYFCGDVMPRLPALRQLPVDALMVEESKKDFIIDIGEVRKGVGPDMCLLGNIDAYEVVEKATEAELEAEIARQVRVAGVEGGFIVGVGSPLTLTTPPERADLLVRCARKQAPGMGETKP